MQIFNPVGNSWVFLSTIESQRSTNEHLCEDHDQKNEADEAQI